MIHIKSFHIICYTDLKNGSIPAEFREKKDNKKLLQKSTDFCFKNKKREKSQKDSLQFILRINRLT